MTILKSLVLKLGETNSYCLALFNLYMQNFHANTLLNEKTDQMILDDFRQALLNNDISINDLLDLIINAF